MITSRWPMAKRSFFVIFKLATVFWRWMPTDRLSKMKWFWCWTVNPNDQVRRLDQFCWEPSTLRLALFFSIETETGHRLSLTGSHFIAVDHQDAFLPAHQIKARDVVFIHEQGKVRAVTVRNVSEEYRVGYFTPMTVHGKSIVFETRLLLALLQIHL